jgi:hypothetical protein
MTVPNKGKKLLDNFIKYSNIGIQMLVIIIAGVFGGYELDIWMGNKFPVFLLLFSTFALATSIYLAVKDFLKK